MGFSVGIGDLPMIPFRVARVNSPERAANAPSGAHRQAERAARRGRAKPSARRTTFESIREPPRSPLVFRAVIYVVRYLLTSFYTAFWGGVACLAAPFDRDGRSVVWIGRRWVRWILATCGIRVDADGLENVPRDRGCVYMSNHQSVFDIAAIVATLPVPWKFVAKRELTWIPFFGWALALGHQIIVDRRDRGASVRSLERAAERGRAGANVIIFPEGTRSPDTSLREFKSGGFYLAIQAGVPIVPIAVSGSWRITPKRSLRIESGRVLVRYAKPIPTQGLRVDDRGQLKREVHDAILAAYDPDLQGVQGGAAAAQRGEAERSSGGLSHDSRPGTR